MFYQTQVQNVRAGSVVDVSGKILYFMGNFTCQAGDFVWTDGNFVFGHTPARSTPLIFSDNSGVPVAFDNSRGYIKSNGNFKDFNISDADWIINTDKDFFSGNDENIIDAEIGNGGNLLTVTNGFYRFKSAPTFCNHLFTQHYRLIRAQEERFLVCTEVNPYVGQLFDFPDNSFADIPAEDTPVTINQTAIQLKPYADIAEAFALDAKYVIISHSNKENNAVNWTMQPAPPNDFIALSYAAVVGFHLSANGDWDAVISASAMGFCFPYLTFDGSIFYQSFPNGEDKTFSEDLISCINNFEDIVFNRQSLPFQPTFEQYAAFAGTEKDSNNEYTAEFKAYILDKVAYYIPLAKFRYYYWFPIVFSACKVLKVHNGEVVGTIYQSHGGGNVVYAPEEWDEKSTSANYYNDFVFNDYNETEHDKNNRMYFPLDEDYYCDFSPYDALIYDSAGSTFTIPYDDMPKNSGFGYKAYSEYRGYYYSFIDSDAITVATQNNISVDNLFGRQIFIPAPYYVFYGLDNENYSTNPKKNNYPYMCGWFKNPNDDNDDAIINYCFAELKNGLLLGVYGGDLYKIQSGGSYELIGSGLKNFRLREMKRISKARL